MEVAEKLRTLADLAEDWWAVPASTSSVSQLPVIPTLGNLMPSSGVHSTDVVCTTPPTHTHTPLASELELKQPYLGQPGALRNEEAEETAGRLPTASSHQPSRHLCFLRGTDTARLWISSVSQF